MEKTNNIMSNMNRGNKKGHAGRNAAIIGGAALAGAASAAAANYFGTEEIIPEVEEGVDVDYTDAEIEEVEVEQEVATSYAGFRHHVSTPQEVEDPIVDDVDGVALNVDEEPFDAVVIDDDLAIGMPEAFDIEFIETGDDEFATSIVDLDDDNLMTFDGDFEEIDINFEDDSTIEDIITDDIDDSGFDADIF